MGETRLDFHWDFPTLVAKTSQDSSTDYVEPAILSHSYHAIEDADQAVTKIRGYEAVAELEVETRSWSGT